jgi:uncharacterized protein with PQ loop repeat
MNKDLVGYAAGIFTTGAFIPQVYKVYKEIVRKVYLC